MVLFNLQFGGGPAGTRALYYNGEAVPCAGGGLSFRAGDTASFDTYFNLFSHAKYARYCGIGACTLVLHGEGRFFARFFRAGSAGEEEFAAFEFTGELSAPLDLAALPQEGFIYCTLTALTEGRIFSGYYAAQPPCVREVRLAAVICTYRREAFTQETVRRLCEAMQTDPAWAERLHIFVADNGGTLRMPRSPLYTLLPGRNLGGTGGFTRGMLAALDDGSFTHVLLMDDDILFSFETLARTYRLLCCLLPEYEEATLGGGMLTLEKPTVQYEAGGYYNGFHLRSCGHGLDLTERASLLEGEGESGANFAAWWYCCMAAETIRANGLPLPFFIKSDDIEYGIRCRKEILLFNGIGVWHQDFAGKYNAALEYYIRRNEAVTAILHFTPHKARPKFALLYHVFKQLTLKRYDSAELIVRAYEDFLRGPQFFLKTDAEALNAEILAARAPTLTQAQLHERFPSLELADPPPAKRLPVFLRAFLLIENFLPAFCFRKAPVVLPEHDTPVAKAFLRRTAVHYNSAAGQGRVCELDTKRRRELRRRTWKLFFAFLSRYKTLKLSYISHFLQLSSRRQWEKQFRKKRKK